MSTIFFARIRPCKEAKEALKGAIDIDFYKAIEDCYNEMYKPLYYDFKDKMFKGGYVHLGKRSCDWKFLWNPNIFIKRNGHTEEIEYEDGSTGSRWVADPSETIYLYPLTKKGIKAFIDRPDVDIYDEYNVKQWKYEFWDMALNWGCDNDDIGYDAGTYEEKYPENKKYICESELIRLLEGQGYKFSSSTKSDFYSDGLRFSTSTEFC